MGHDSTCTQRPPVSFFASQIIGYPLTMGLEESRLGLKKFDFECCICQLWQESCLAIYDLAIMMYSIIFFVAVCMLGVVS